MGSRGNPYDNAKAESLMKTMKVEEVYPMASESFEDTVENLPSFIEEVYNKCRLYSASVNSVHNDSKTSTPGRRSSQRHDPYPCPAEGAHTTDLPTSAAQARRQILRPFRLFYGPAARLRAIGVTLTARNCRVKPPTTFSSISYEWVPALATGISARCTRSSSPTSPGFSLRC